MDGARTRTWCNKDAVAVREAVLLRMLQSSEASCKRAFPAGNSKPECLCVEEERAGDIRICSVMMRWSLLTPADTLPKL